MHFTFCFPRRANPEASPNHSTFTHIHSTFTHIHPPPHTQVLRVPWYEWNELGFREDERVAYLESLLLRVAGLTIDEARVVPGGVKPRTGCRVKTGDIRTRAKSPTATRRTGSTRRVPAAAWPRSTSTRPAAS
jgi:hypothetical protein